MADFSVPNGVPPAKPRTFDFEKIALLGNAGKKINRVVDEFLSPYVNDPEPPIERQVVGTVIKIPSLEFRAVRKFLTSGIHPANPSSAELLRYQLPSGRIVTPEELAALVRGLPEPHVLPMWAADP